MSVDREFSIPGKSGYSIRGNIHLPADADAAVPLVLFMHGFKGFKDWGPWSSVCDRFAEEGVAAVRFDLSHNGVGDDGVAFSALDRFEKNTIDAELFDLAAVLDAVGPDGEVGASIREEIEIDGLFLLGHSRGGAGVLLGAHERLTQRAEGSGSRGDKDDGGGNGGGNTGDELIGVVTWGAISTYERGWDEAVEIWKKGESVPMWNKRTEQWMPLGPQLYEDYLAQRERYDILKATETLASHSVPLLIVHGMADETVPFEEASNLRDAYEDAMKSGDAGDDARVFFCEVPGGDHTFGTKHPFAGWTPELTAAFEPTLEFVRGTLG